jgi:hypothetical protein
LEALREFNYKDNSGGGGKVPPGSGMKGAAATAALLLILENCGNTPVQNDTNSIDKKEKYE